jgi:hypothetical protein
MSPAIAFGVRNVTGTSIPETIEEPFQTIMARALAQRPDLQGYRTSAFFQLAPLRDGACRLAFHHDAVTLLWAPG